MASQAVQNALETYAARKEQLEVTSAGPAPGLGGV